MLPIAEAFKLLFPSSTIKKMSVLKTLYRPWLPSFRLIVVAFGSIIPVWATLYGVYANECPLAPKIGEVLREPKTSFVFTEAGTSNLYWATLSNEFQMAWIKFIREKNEIYQNARKGGDKFVAFLEEMGCRFEPPFSAPLFHEILSRYESRIGAFVHAGVIAESDVLRPGFVVKTADGKLMFLRFGQEKPLGATLYSGLLSDDAFLAMLSEGLYPVGGTNVILGGYGALAFEHDLAHLAAFVENPKYMAELKRSATRLRKAGVTLGTDSANTSEQTKLSNRLFHVVEGLSVIPTSERHRLEQILRLPAKTDPSKVYTVEEVYAHLKSLPIPELKTLRDRIRAEVPPLFQHLGGTYKDVVTQNALAQKQVRSRFHAYDETLRSIFQTLLAPRDHGLVYDDQIIHQMARLEVALYESSRIDPETWVRDALQEHLSKDSALYKFICETKIWQPKEAYLKSIHRIYFSHCLP